MRHSIGNQTTQ